MPVVVLVLVLALSLGGTGVKVRVRGGEGMWWPFAVVHVGGNDDADVRQV